MKRVLAYLFCSLFLLSCRSHKEVKKIRPHLPPVAEQLINWKVMNNEGRRNRSFPVWFNTSMIDSLKIQSVTLSFINNLKNDSTIYKIAEDTLYPYRRSIFNFGKKGYTKGITVLEYHNGLQIIQQNFSYTSPPDKLGYSPVNMTSKRNYSEKQTLPLLNTMRSLQGYKRLILQKKDSSLLLFRDENSLKKTEYIYILDSTNQNVTFIDNHFRPTKNKVFIYGYPIDFSTRFEITNLVEKTKQKDQSFYPNGVLQSQSFYSTGFVKKRRFLYDSLGYVTEYTDSLFSVTGAFIHSERNIIHYSTNHLPRAIDFYNRQDTAGHSPIRTLTFEYQYREKEGSS